MISRTTIEQCKNINIVDVILPNVALKPTGGENYKGLCPFHNEKSPSFSVSGRKGIYKCFGCGKTGNAITFIQEHFNLDFVEAIRHLCTNNNIEFIEEKGIHEDTKPLTSLMGVISDYFQEKLLVSETAYNYISKERGFNNETIKRFNIGYAPHNCTKELLHIAMQNGFTKEDLTTCGLIALSKHSNQHYCPFEGRLIFPIKSKADKVIAFSGRIIIEDPNKKAGKYVNSPESPLYHKSKVLYNLNMAKGTAIKNRCIYIVEGYTDAIAMYEAGVKNVVATCGTAFTNYQADEIRRVSLEAVLLTDSDKAGAIAAAKSISVLLKSGVIPYAARLPKEIKDPDKLFSTLPKDEAMQYIENAKVDFVTFKFAYFTEYIAPNKELSLSDKYAFIEDIRQDIAIIPDVVIRSLAINRVASITGLSEFDVNSIVKNAQRAIVEQTNSQASQKPKENAVSEKAQAFDFWKNCNRETAIELELIYTMITYPTLDISVESENGTLIGYNVCNYIIENINADGFLSPYLNTILTTLSKILLSGYTIDYSTIIDTQTSCKLYGLQEKEADNLRAYCAKIISLKEAQSSTIAFKTTSNWDKYSEKEVHANIMAFTKYIFALINEHTLIVLRQFIAKQITDAANAKTAKEAQTITSTILNAAEVEKELLSKMAC